MSNLQSLLLTAKRDLAPGQPIPRSRWPGIAAQCGPAERAEISERITRLEAELAKTPDWDGDTRDDIHRALEMFRELSSRDTLSPTGCPRHRTPLPSACGLTANEGTLTMQDLINRVVENVGIDPATAQPAIGIVLNLLKSVLPEGTVQSLMAAIPGADALMGAADSQAGGGGITGMLGGALASVTGGSTGAVTKALGQLQGLGLDTGTSKSLVTEVVNFAKENAPADVVAQIEQNLPSQFT